MKYLVLTMCLFMMSCGKFDRWKVAMTGSAVETCHDGVIYLQFTSGSSVKYTREGKIALCN